MPATYSTATYSATTHIDAPPEVVWARIGDVRHWGDWLPTVTSVTPADQAIPDGVGTRYTVVQPKLPRATWQITAYDPGRAFTWVSSAPGVTTTATHDVVARDGGSDVTLAVTWTGVGTALLRLLYGRLTQRYVDTEAATLKQLSQSQARSAS